MGLKTSLQNTSKENLEKIILKVHRKDKKIASFIDDIINPKNIKKYYESKKERQVINAINKKESVRKICEKYGLNKSKVYKIAKNNNIDLISLHKSPIKDNILLLHNQSISNIDIASKLKISRQYVYRVVKNQEEK